MLWPDVIEASARQSLSQALSNMRKVLKDRDAEQPFFIITREGVQRNPDASLTTDVAELRLALHGHSKGTQLQPASNITTLYGGAFLEGFTLVNAEGFEEWGLLQRESLQREAIEAFDQFIHQRLTAGDLGAAIQAARRQLELDPWREESHRHLMLAYALNGQRGDAIAQYEKCRKALAEELRIEPSQATKRLLEDIRAGKITAVESGSAVASAASPSQPAPARPPPKP